MTEQEMIENLKCVIADLKEQCNELKAQNVALRARLEKAVELPYKPDKIDVGLTKFVMSVNDETVRAQTAIYIYKTAPNMETAQAIILSQEDDDK